MISGSVHLRLPRAARARVQRLIAPEYNGTSHESTTVDTSLVQRCIAREYNGSFHESAMAASTLVQVAVPLEWGAER
ncbi:hypothetical protein LDFHOB_05875 [Candidatus Electronema aureum]